MLIPDTSDTPIFSRRFRRKSRPLEWLVFFVGIFEENPDSYSG